VLFLCGLASWRERFLFRTVSQTAVNYRTSPLSQGRAGRVHGGDRLPWTKTRGLEDDSFKPLTSLDWQVHIYGNAGPEIRAEYEQRRLPLHVFICHRAMARSGLRRDAVYLVRPDGYVAMVDREGHAEALTPYFCRHQITTTGLERSEHQPADTAIRKRSHTAD
jgi:hypothetical protein